uniref:DUF7745 domain-containing protein n=1 Tax=Fagus sylvatica TaxID=28930 RepID=A0A2N9HHT3_FAGSY
MASSSSDPDSLVTLRFHDFRVERMRHWWTLLGEDDHADIVGIFGKFPPFMRLQVDRGLLEALASFWDPTHCCFSIGEVDLIPTMEEYAKLLQLDSPFSETPVIPIQGPRSNRCLEKYLGLTTAVLRPEIARPEATWRKANISLDLLTKYFSRSAFPARLARDFIAGKKEWKKFRINAFKIAFAGIFLFPTSAGRIDLGVIPIETGRGGPDVLHAAPSALVLQSPAAFSIASRLLIILRGHTVTWGPASWMPWTHCALFDGVPLPGVWGCTGHYPSLALRHVEAPPSGLRTSGEVVFQRWSSSRRVRPEIALLPRTLSSGERGGLPFSPSGLQYGQVHHIPLISRSLRVSASTGRLRGEASAARVESLRSTLHHNSVAVANLRRDLVAQRGNVSTLRTMNEFIREQLEISEDAKEQLEENLGRGSGAAGD